MPDLLYEIGTEELPAGYIQPALEQLADGLKRLLAENRLAAEEVATAGAPRRLTLAVAGIPEQQPPMRTKSVGPPARAAFDADGQPTAAALGFARSKGLAVEDLQVEETLKGPYVFAVVEEPGRPAAEMLPELLAQVTSSLPFPKSMRWEPGGFAFARPIRWLVVLLDDQVLPLEIAGVRAGRATRGHRFLAPGALELPDASYDAYCAALERAHVVVDDRKRRARLRAEVAAILSRHGSELRDEPLLDEVANMVEWPHALEGSFHEGFLSMPAPVLVAAMTGHQYDFPVWGADGRLLPRFVAVSDRTDEHDDLVREGNERVLRARLEDAKFFWEHDSRQPLDALVPRLEGVVFLGGLGNNLQRAERLAELGGRIAERIGEGVSVEHVRRAARLCKADLLSDLVGEFPGLQGVVGREIARLHGEPDAVADAIAEHYLPAGADDRLPETPEGCALALADKLDVIVGCFALGLQPSGSQDPYALRRNALGVLRILEEKALPLRLDDLTEMAIQCCPADGIESRSDLRTQLVLFFVERLAKAALSRGFRHDFVTAVDLSNWRYVQDFWSRLEALADCSRRPWWPELVELVDRTHRIHRDVEGLPPVRDDLLQEPLEKELAAALAEQRERIVGLFRRSDYVAAAEAYCSAFARLVHDFFEEVFVNVEDQAVRANRKALCREVCTLFVDNFANLYRIQTADAHA